MSEAFLIEMPAQASTAAWSKSGNDAAATKVMSVKLNESASNWSLASWEVPPSPGSEPLMILVPSAIAAVALAAGTRAETSDVTDERDAVSMSRTSKLGKASLV